MTEQSTLPERRQVPVEHTWDLKSIFPSEEAWAAACREIEQQIPRLARFEGRLGQGSKMLLDWFNTRAHVFRMRDQVLFYAYGGHAVDTTDQEAAARLNRARSLSARLLAVSAFAEPEILSIGQEQLDKWMASEPELAVYEHYLERLEHQRPHTRSAEVEEVLARVSEPFVTASTTASMLTNADLTFGPARGSDGVDREVAQGSIRKLLLSPDRELRRSAWESYADGYLQFRNTLANSLLASIQQDVFRMRARNYSSSLEVVLAPQNIPVEVFHNLIRVFKQNLPTWHRYWRLVREALGYDVLYEYDIFAPLVDEGPSVPYEQAVAWLVEGMTPLGDEYVSVMRRGALDERWVDIYPNRGKRAGAFSYGATGTHPFILMSYTDDILSLSTLAHEFGHSMHSYYSWGTQPYVYGQYSLFVAEVASNFNQALVRSYLLEQEPDALFQQALLEEAMKNFHRYFFIMPTLARFELETHQRVERGEPLTAQSMIELTADLFEEAYGGEVVTERERLGITWAQFDHLYRSFYVYQYATGISGAHALAEGVLAGRPGAVENYLQFLMAGGSMYPLDALRLAGVDLTSPEPVELAFAALGDYVDRLEGLIRQRQPASQ